jgi:hypothetical protein
MLAVGLEISPGKIPSKAEFPPPPPQEIKAGKSAVNKRAQSDFFMT